MPDTLEKWGKGTVVQHGKLSDRIYLMKLGRDDYPAALDRIEALGAQHGYGKIFAKAPAFAREGFQERGYRQEAHVSGFYRGEEDAYFWAKFLDEGRSVAPDRVTIEQVLEAASRKIGQVGSLDLPPRYAIRSATPDDCEGMATVYEEVFETYPWPIHDPDYLRRTMNENFVYFVVTNADRRIVAVASCEMDEEGKNVEMTDFATLESERGHGLSTILLDAMESAMRERDMITGFTIARSASFGMNIVFAKHAYQFAGTLINNSQICGQLESMNVWYKKL